MKRKKYKPCPFCSEKVVTKTKLCPHCGRYLVKYHESIAKLDRNKQIVDEVETGISYRKLGKKYNLTDTRIKEIYDRFK